MSAVKASASLYGDDDIVEDDWPKDRRSIRLEQGFERQSKWKRISAAALVEASQKDPIAPTALPIPAGGATPAAQLTDRKSVTFADGAAASGAAVAVPAADIATLGSLGSGWS